MHPLAEKVDDISRVQNFFPGTGSIIVAVSGGIDSMALLHLLATPALGLRDRLFVAHFNHQLRGPESDADAAIVGQAAERLGLRFETGSGNARQLAAETGDGIEAAARQLRHDFFARLARRLSAWSPWPITPTTRSRRFFCGCCAARATAAWPACSPARRRRSIQE